jgi:sugar O-acyltransferase (sialic acid O-acetyltransferase NeuD family)
MCSELGGLPCSKDCCVVRTLRAKFTTIPGGIAINMEEPVSRKSIYAVVGAGGFGREVMPMARADISMTLHRAVKDELYFIEYGAEFGSVSGFRALSEENFIATEADTHYFNVAVEEFDIRQRLWHRFVGYGAVPFTIVAPDATIYEDAELGQGAIVCNFTIITSKVKIGGSFLANFYSYVGHDCVIGDFVTFGPRVSCNGHVHIHHYAHIGTGAVIKAGTRDKPTVIGEGAIVEMGAVVSDDVRPYARVAGNPAKPVAAPP